MKLKTQELVSPFYMSNYMSNKTYRSYAGVLKEMAEIYPSNAATYVQGLIGNVSPFIESLSAYMAKDPLLLDKPKSTSIAQDLWAQLISKSGSRIALLDKNFYYLCASDSWIKWAKNHCKHKDLFRKDKNHLELFAGCPQRLKNYMKQSLEGTPFKKEFVCYRGYEGTCEDEWLTWESFPWRDENGKVAGVVLFTEDITNIKTLRDETRRLSKSNASLEDFAQICSHDLVEPLRRLVNLTHLMEISKPDERAKYVHAIHQAADRMHHLIHGILNYSTAGQMLIDETWVSCSKIIETIEEYVVAPLGGKSIQMEITTPLPMIHINRVVLHQLFQNLITNAIKYADHNQPRIEISCEKIDSEYVFCVKDNGPGIEEHMKDVIFMPLQRGIGANKQDGAGVGLAICKKITHAYGGDIWVESVLGQGA
ncbi:MAG TPA: ATP-binding protein, partial [Alphaproteobacteria bacterium]|nr:ATP-binding protein [Alphaproteobacteria bacterium]